MDFLTFATIFCSAGAGGMAFSMGDVTPAMSSSPYTVNGVNKGMMEGQERLTLQFYPQLRGKFIMNYCRNYGLENDTGCSILA